eukprot:scaffold22642_cov134-Cylindrotheca_fusiformis.AAC.27
MQSLFPAIFCLDHEDSLPSRMSPLHPSQVHHRLCQRLSKNDPSIQTVEFRYQHIDLQQLAKACANNTNLKTLELVASVQSIGGGIPSSEELEHIYYNGYDEEQQRPQRSLKTGFPCFMIQPPRWPLTNEIFSGSSRGIYVLAFDGLMYNRGLVSLDLSQNCLGRFGASCIQQALRYHPTLKRLNLSRCQLEEEGLQRLATHNNSKLGIVLEELVLSHNRIGNGIFLGKILFHNQNLKILDLSYNCVTDRDCENFVAACGYGSLLSLDLASNRISGIGASALGASLQLSNTALQSLILDGNPLGDQGAISLATNGLANNASVVDLSLKKCNIGDKGAIGIAENLSCHQSVKELYLTSNSLGTAGAVACLQTPLTKIDLAFNNIREEQEVVSILQSSNMTLKDLDMRQNPMRTSRHSSCQANFWTTLNATGARRLLQHQQHSQLAPVSMSLWPQILERATDRPDCLYYLLKHLPGIAILAQSR